MDNLTELEQIQLERDHMEGLILNTLLDYHTGKSIHLIMNELQKGHGEV